MKQGLIILGVILFIVIGGVIIFSIPWGGSESEETPIEKAEEQLLTDLADSNARVKMYVRDEVNNEADHRDMEISVGANSVSAKIYKGYEQATIRSQTTSNSTDSYRIFLSALLNSGFNIERKERINVSEEGFCPNGSLYTFSITGSEEEMETWISSCSSKIGTFGGDLSAVRTLFRDQVNDYFEFVEDTPF